MRILFYSGFKDIQCFFIVSFQNMTLSGIACGSFLESPICDLIIKFPCLCIISIVLCFPRFPVECKIPAVGLNVIGFSGIVVKLSCFC